MKRLALSFAILAALVGCSKAESNPTVSKLEVVMNIETISSDILNYFDVEYNYVDFNGKSVSKAITKPEKITFSVANPQLGEESSCPFTAEFKLTQKSTEEKSTGSYDSSISWELDVNAYNQSGSLITDSGVAQSKSSDVPYSNDKFANFTYAVSKLHMESITYRTFFCKTISGEWHIGIEGSKN